MRTAWNGFHSPLAAHIEQYLATKRALGCKFASEDRMLRLLDRFLVEQRIGSMDNITGECLDQFLASRGRDNPRSYNHLLGVVRRLFEWIASQQAIPASPLQTRPRRETARRLPFLFEPRCHQAVAGTSRTAARQPSQPHARADLRDPLRAARRARSAYRRGLTAAVR
jgi:site-specific recombinase XerD